MLERNYGRIINIVSLNPSTAAHQGWSANIFTTVSGMFPQHAVGSVVGIGGTVSAVGSMLSASVVGLVLQANGSYSALFLAAGTAYLVALAVFHLLAPKMQPVEL